jgi:hypothetical protein
MILRLEREKGHLNFYPTFEARLRRFVEKYADKAESCPVDSILHEMVNRWINTPALAGYFLALDEDDFTIGHLASWITNYYGQNRLYVWQAEMDEGQDVLEPMVVQLKSWIAEVNSKLPCDFQVTRWEWLTWHPMVVWQRYLRKTGLTVSQTHSLIEGTL